MNSWRQLVNCANDIDLHLLKSDNLNQTKKQTTSYNQHHSISCKQPQSTSLSQKTLQGYSIRSLTSFSFCFIFFRIVRRPILTSLLSSLCLQMTDSVPKSNLMTQTCQTQIIHSRPVTSWSVTLLKTSIFSCFRKLYVHQIIKYYLNQTISEFWQK